MAFSFETDSKGYIKKRESYDLEYKQNFQLGDHLLKYIKTLVGMANNKGGQIVFGIQDSPHILLGMKNNNFLKIDPKVIDAKVREYFSPDIRWQSAIQEFEGKNFGVLSVEESEEKPIVCKKNNDNILREGAIYYRYRGETKEIEYPALKKILDKEREKERILWIKHIERIAMVGPQNIHLLDRYNGEITYDDSKILLDKSLIDQLKFIKEGHFTEKEGEGSPTLKLVGTIEGLVDVNNAIIDPNVAYPLTTRLLQKELGLNQYEMQSVIYSLGLKNKPKRHMLIMQGEKSNGIHKYSKSVVSAVQKLMEQRGKEVFVNECIEKYKEHMREMRKEKINE